MGLWERLTELPVAVEEVALEGLRLRTRSGWERRSTIVRLQGRGRTGVGEDLTWSAEEQERFLEEGMQVLAPLRGAAAPLGALCEELDALDLYGGRPVAHNDRDLRRYGLESALLDLALEQNGLDLPRALGMPPRPVRFVVSLGLGSPPSEAPLHSLRERFPGLGFKLDWAPSWDEALLQELAELGGVEVVDFKGHYRGGFEGPPPDPQGYRRTAELLPGAILEDPVAEGPAWEALAPFRSRVAWDAPVHSLEDLRALPQPAFLNLKPSRFGRLEELFRVVDHARSSGLPTYGGGQFELGPGRIQAQILAALLHPEAANDLSPVAFHEEPPGPAAAAPPLQPAGLLASLAAFRNPAGARPR